MNAFQLLGFVILFGQGVPAEDVSLCPHKAQLQGTQYLHVRGTLCYQFVLFHLRPYVTAKADCARMGGSLALVKSADTNNYLLNYMRTTYRDLEKVWIGMNDRELEGTYKWEDGTAVNDTGFTNWAKGQGPQGGTEHDVEDCIALDPSDGGKWHDFRCKTDLFDPFQVFDHEMSYICQYNIAPEGTTPEPTAAPTTTPEPTAAPTSPTTPTTTPEPECPPFNCERNCGLDGYVIDGNGCATCACNRSASACKRDCS